MVNEMVDEMMVDMSKYHSLFFVEQFYLILPFHIKKENKEEYLKKNY